jgi:hypothetical protein
VTRKNYSNPTPTIRENVITQVTIQEYGIRMDKKTPMRGECVGKGRGHEWFNFVVKPRAKEFLTKINLNRKRNPRIPMKINYHK